MVVLPNLAAATFPSGDEFKVALQRLTRDLLAAQPRDVGTSVTALRYGVRYHSGTLVQDVSPAFVQLANSIYIPEKAVRQPMPADVLVAYMTGRDVYGSSISIEAVKRRLRTADIQETLVFCASLLRSMDQSLVDPGRDRYLAGHLGEPYRTRAMAGIEAGNALVAPQAVVLLTKLALAICPHTPCPERADGRWQLAALLAIQDSLNLAQGEPEAHIDGIHGDARAAAVLIQSQVFHTRREPVSMLAHSHLRWRVLPRRQGGFNGFADLGEAFASLTGVSLDDFVSVGVAVWALAIRTAGPLIDASQLSLQIPRSRINAALRLLSASPTVLAREIRADARDSGSEWSFEILRHYPIIKLGRSLVVLSPRLVLERVFDLVWIDVERALLAKGGPDAGRLRRFWDLICEEDATETLSAIAEDVPGQKRLYRQVEMQTAFDSLRRKRKCSDFAIDYPSAWVVGDVTTSSLNRQAAVGGSIEAINDGLAKIVAKARQIESTIQDLQASETLLTGAPAQARRAYVPLLIMAEGFPVNPVTSALLQARLSTAKVLQGPRIGPLHLIDLEELSMVEALAEQGHSLLELLQQHEQGGYKWMSLKDFVLLEAKLKPGPASRLKPFFDGAWHPILDVLRRTSPA